MIRETCSRTGTLRSLKAVVMKQPKVSAAITLSEKAKSEFARDRTVFIVTPFPQEPCRRHPSPRLRFPAAPLPTSPLPPAHPVRTFRERAPPRPAPFPVLGTFRERARSLPLGHTHRAAVHALEGGALSQSANQR